MMGSAVRLEFRLLGPLEVRREGRLLRLGGERQRSLLALLVLHANEVVPSERLIEQLFGERVSESAANALQVGISRLRRLLGDGRTANGDGVVVTRPPGYLLRADAEQLDVAVFERLLGEGRRALAASDAVTASATLREALALWRGPALADLALLEFAQAEIRRLEELRLAALMERIEADLALGRPDDVIPELEALIAANPLQERPRGQLMLALYRSGRQADALEVYRLTRELLREELGLEPSRALQDLERSILNQDPALAPTARPPRHTPSNLPATTETGTIVCADIEAFTPLIRELAIVEFRALVTELQRIMQTTFEEEEGHGVVTVGDSVVGVFRSARAAVAASLRLREAIASHRWPGARTLKANIALHSGDVIATGAGYFGVAVNDTFALLESRICRGGRIVVSESTKGLLDSGDLVLRRCDDVAPGQSPAFELISDCSTEPLVATLSSEPNVQ